MGTWSHGGRDGGRTGGSTCGTLMLQLWKSPAVLILIGDCERSLGQEGGRGGCCSLTVAIVQLSLL